jgi:hypothetical protein
LLSQQPNLAQTDNQYLFMLNTNHINTLLPEILLIINSVTINFIIDLGATINVIDQNTFSQMQPQPQLQQTTTSIHAYQSTDTIKTMGSFTTLINHHNTTI